MNAIGRSTLVGAPFVYVERDLWEKVVPLELSPLSPTYERDKVLQDLFIRQYEVWEKKTSWHVEESDRKIAIFILINGCRNLSIDQQDFLKQLRSQAPIGTAHMTQFLNGIVDLWARWRSRDEAGEAEWDFFYKLVLHSNVEIRDRIVVFSERDVSIQDSFFELFALWEQNTPLDPQAIDRENTALILEKLCPRVSIVNKPLLEEIRFQNPICLKTKLEVLSFLEELWREWKKDLENEKWDFLLNLEETGGKDCSCLIL